MVMATAMRKFDLVMVMMEDGICWESQWCRDIQPTVSAFTFILSPHSKAVVFRPLLAKEMPQSQCEMAGVSEFAVGVGQPATGGNQVAIEGVDLE